MSAHVEQLRGTRDWMDNTFDRHAYMCFPVSLTNRLGWGISFPKDIKFIWDGIEDSRDFHVTILEGEEYVFTGRGHGTVSFYGGLIIKTDEDTSMLTMPTPNLFIRGIQPFTTIMSTSFYKGEFPLALKITEPNKEITIPAGTPIFTILPISIKGLQDDYEMNIIEGDMPREYYEELKKYGDASEIKNSVGDWSKMYRDAINYDGSSMGSHESKNIKLRTVSCPVTGESYSVSDN
jgi:hypothetical protein